MLGGELRTPIVEPEKRWNGDTEKTQRKGEGNSLGEMRKPGVVLIRRPDEETKPSPQQSGLRAQHRTITMPRLNPVQFRYLKPSNGNKNSIDSKRR